MPSTQARRREKIAALARDPGATEGERAAAVAAQGRIGLPAEAKRPELNETIVKGLPVPAEGAKVHYFPGAVLQGKETPRGFGVRVTSQGTRAFILNYRIKGVEHRYTIGQYPDWSVLKAVKHARDLRTEKIDRGLDPLDDKKAADKAGTVSAVLDKFVADYLVAKGRRSKDDYERAFDRLVKPAIGKIDIKELRRSDITTMLNKIAKNNGAVMSDRTLAYPRSNGRRCRGNSCGDAAGVYRLGLVMGAD